MYIALYNSERSHITNVSNVTYDKTERVYDPDSFSAEGVSSEDINDAKIVVVNDEQGNYRYACFADSITRNKNKRTVKGIDFKTLWDTEILLDYTTAGSFDGKLSAIFNKIKKLVFDSADSIVQKIPVHVIIPEDTTDTTAVYGSYQGTYQIVNAYTFLKCYLKYYEYNLESSYDVENGRIIFTFAKHTDTVAVNLNDFIYELTTSSSATNKAVATVKFDVASGTARPSVIDTRYFYRTENNDIVMSDSVGDIPGRIYPARAKMFESDKIANSLFDAVYELANARYVDNIVIDNNVTTDPVDFAYYPLYTKVELYYAGKLYKTLPISEKITTLSSAGESIKIKLGFKKILLTEIIKA